MEQEINQPIVMSTEGLKLTKTTKGYTWEIKLLELNVDRLDEINEKMKARYEGD